MAAWRLDGNPRPPRQWTGDQNGPWPTPAEPRCFLLPALQPSALHVVQGRRCGMGQRTAQQGRHVHWPGRLAARRALGAAPARSLTALAQRRGGGPGPRGPWPGRRPGRPPVAPDGTARRLVRPQAPAAQTAWESGKTQDHPGNNVLRVQALLTLVLLSAPDGGPWACSAPRGGHPLSTPGRAWGVAGPGGPVRHAP